ncbi:MAG: GAF domain-containing protein [Elainellaceae cyanobacterium]
MSIPDPGLAKVADSLGQKLKRDTLVQQTADYLRKTLDVDRVVLYYFYYEWKGQVTFESLRSDDYSIYGSTGADECFNDEYAAMYLEGRVRAIADIETEPIHPCHKDFLRSIQVRANLVVPVLVEHRLWGLLVAHHCQNRRDWSATDVMEMLDAAEKLAMSPVISASDR